MKIRILGILAGIVLVLSAGSVYAAGPPTSPGPPVATTSCPGVSSTTIQAAEKTVLTSACAAGKACATDTAQCKKAALQASLKQGFMTLMNTYNISPFCAGAITLAVAQSGADGQQSPLSCP